MGFFQDDEEELTPKPLDPMVLQSLAAKYPGQMPQKPMSDVEKFNQDFSDDAYKQAQASAEEKQSGLGWAQFAGGLGDALAGRDSSKTAANFEGIRNGIKDDTVGAFEKRKASALQDYKTKRDMSENATSDATKLRESDVNSEESKISRALAARMGMDAKSVSSLTAAKFKTLSPVLEKMYEIEQKKITRSEDRQEKSEVRAERNLARSQKEKDLSATQAKQLGTYNMGSLAEEQYKKSIENKNDYDPTVSGQFIDNSRWAPNFLKNDKAIASQSSKDNWIESFLRDASGAAIAPSERGAYESIFFPQEGDTPQVVANKESLRKQKMDNALIGTGRTGQEMIANKPPPLPESDIVKIKDPKGIVRSIPKNQVSAAIAAGGTLLDTVAGQ